MEMKVPRGVDMIEALFAMEGKTAWIIDVWDCHGVLKQQAWGVGYGCQPDLPATSRSNSVHRQIRTPCSCKY